MHEHSQNFLQHRFTLNSETIARSAENRERSQWVIHRPMAPTEPPTAEEIGTVTAFEQWAEAKSFSYHFDIELIDWIYNGRALFFDLHPVGNLQPTMALYAIDLDLFLVVTPTVLDGTKQAAVYRIVPLKAKQSIRIAGVMAQPESTGVGGFTDFYVDEVHEGRVSGAQVHPGRGEMNPFAKIGLDVLPGDIHNRQANITIRRISGT